MNETQNPNRQCKICGSIGNSYEIKKSDGGIIYTAKCKTCINNEAKKRVFVTCQKCSQPKDENYNRYCSECINEKRWFIEPEDLIKIKRWVRKQEIRHFMTDLSGLNELITMYQIVSHREGEFDHLSSSKQLQKMWDKVFKVYNEIKDINDETLAKIKLDKIGLKIKKKENMIKKLENSDLDFFFQIMSEYEFEGKIYTFQEEYLDCVSGISKVSCVRCRKIIQEMRRELVRLRNKTGVKQYKNGKK